MPYFFGEHADMSTELNKQRVIKSSYIVIAVGLFLTGPSNLLPIGKSVEIPVIIAGLFV